MQIVRHSAADAGMILVTVYALEFEMFAIEENAVGINFYRPDPEAQNLFIYNFSIGNYLDMNAIEIRIVQIPKSGMVDSQG